MRQGNGWELRLGERIYFYGYNSDGFFSPLPFPTPIFTRLISSIFLSLSSCLCRSMWHHQSSHVFSFVFFFSLPPHPPSNWIPVDFFCCIWLQRSRRTPQVCVRVHACIWMCSMYVTLQPHKDGAINERRDGRNSVAIIFFALWPEACCPGCVDNSATESHW